MRAERVVVNWLGDVVVETPSSSRESGRCPHRVVSIRMMPSYFGRTARQTANHPAWQHDVENTRSGWVSTNGLAVSPRDLDVRFEFRSSQILVVGQLVVVWDEKDAWVILNHKPCRAGLARRRVTCFPLFCRTYASRSSVWECRMLQ